MVGFIVFLYLRIFFFAIQNVAEIYFIILKLNFNLLPLVRLKGLLYFYKVNICSTHNA